jgi:N-acyl-D-amino-acid deacylase
MRKVSLCVLIGLLGLGALFGVVHILSHPTESATPPLDLIITHGRILDGTGNPWFIADMGVKSGRIVEVGRLSSTRASRVIDAKGQVVAPGFIDVHTHVEGGLDTFPTADNFLQMGVTTVITGNCGASRLPLGEWFSKLRQAGISINVGSLVGHNSLRHEAMNGDFDRPPTSEELRRMQELVHRAMLDGAMGLSTGLEYSPGMYAKIDEIVALAKVAAQFGGIYATHMRNEDATVEHAIQEALEVGEKANCPVEISHFKISNQKRWGASAITTRMVADARSKGQPVTVDQYVYTAGSTGVEILFENWSGSDQVN